MTGDLVDKVSLLLFSHFIRDSDDDDVDDDYEDNDDGVDDRSSSCGGLTMIPKITPSSPALAPQETLSPELTLCSLTNWKIGWWGRESVVDAGCKRQVAAENRERRRDRRIYIFFPSQTTTN